MPAYKHIHAASDELLRMSSVELKAAAKGRGKKAEAAKDEIARRKSNRAAKRAALASS